MTTMTLKKFSLKYRNVEVNEFRCFLCAPVNTNFGYSFFNSVEKRTKTNPNFDLRKYSINSKLPTGGERDNTSFSWRGWGAGSKRIVENFAISGLETFGELCELWHHLHTAALSTATKGSKSALVSSWIIERCVSQDLC